MDGWSDRLYNFRHLRVLRVKKAQANVSNVTFSYVSERGRSKSCYVSRIDHKEISSCITWNTTHIISKDQVQSEQEFFFLKKPEYYFSSGLFRNCMPVEKKKKLVYDGKRRGWRAESLHSSIWTSVASVEQNGEASLNFNCGTVLSALPFTSRCTRPFFFFFLSHLTSAKWVCTSHLFSCKFCSLVGNWLSCLFSEPWRKLEVG